MHQMVDTLWQQVTGEMPHNTATLLLKRLPFATIIPVWKAIEAIRVEKEQVAAVP